MKKEAKFYSVFDSHKVKCELCPHECLISDGKSGICLIRENIGGKLYLKNYGEVCSLALDPIEKKPLYHFYPGSVILSMGTNGCNMKCPFCQNWQISMQETYREQVEIIDLIATAKKRNSVGIAYTYNEPLIWYEFVYDCSVKFKEAGLKNVLVSNGMINEKPLKELLEFIDAVNVDVKSFDESFYKWVKGDLKTVLRNVELMAEREVHLEITYLVITNKNDDYTKFDEMCRWIAKLSKDIPLHISRYFPNYKLNEEATSPKTIIDFYEIAKQYLNYVYIGNMSYENMSNTYCPHCGQLLVERNFYEIKSRLKEDKCPFCQESLYFVL